MVKINGARLKVFSHYPWSGRTTTAQVYVPFSYENSEARSQIYQSWEKFRCLPQKYSELNDFIDEIKSFTHISQLMLGKNSDLGSYICFIITKPDKSTIAQLEKLINN